MKVIVELKLLILFLLQYAQQMILGHPRQVLCMSTYTPVRKLDQVLSFHRLISLNFHYFLSNFEANFGQFYNEVSPTFYRKLKIATTFLQLQCL